MRSLLGSSLALAGLIALSAGCEEEKASVFPGPKDAGKPAVTDAGGAKDAAAPGDGAVAARECTGASAPQGSMCGGAHCNETAAQIATAKTSGAKCGGEGDIAALCSNQAPAVTGSCAGTNAYDGPKTKTCVMGMLTAMTGDCVECFVNSMLCTVSMCAGDCVADANSSACIACRTTKGCISGFYTCAGLKNPTP